MGLAVMAAGLSPQVRGSPIAALERVVLQGSIPAGAGKPGTVSPASKSVGVYPRRCGEASITQIVNPPSGVYPRRCGEAARNSPSNVLAQGSIPAGAGKPRPGRRNGAGLRVYPRRCGEAALMEGIITTEQGLSPQVRGSLNRIHDAVRREGSIPAGAGKPSRPSAEPSVPRVYPRRCGEALAA